ncbi:hypothetical protein HDV05_001111 [Chytridiales sp. JEL 0842]|nr:hypothetical protein HDV05_001111 [Chytridiales sp. JEL 0842]
MIARHLQRRLNHYDTLGISRSATTADVKSRYLEISMKCHPDKARSNPDLTESQRSEMKAQFLAAKMAYETLRDSSKRREYDDELAWKEGTLYDEDLELGVGDASRRTGKASSDFSAWSSYSGLPRYWEKRSEMKRKHWSARMDDAEDGNESGGPFSRFASWFRDSPTYASYQGTDKASTKSGFSFRSFGENLDNGIDMGGSVKSIIRLSIIAWGGVFLFVGGWWLWYKHTVEVSPEKFKERAAKRHASTQWLFQPPPIQGGGYQNPQSTLMLKSEMYKTAPRRVRKGSEPIEPAASIEKEYESRASNSKESDQESQDKQDKEVIIPHFELDSTIVDAMNAAHQRRLTAAMSVVGDSRIRLTTRERN